ATMNGDVETARERCLDTLVVARSFGDSPYASAALVATVETLVLDGNCEAGAYFHGVLRPRLPYLEAVMVPAHREAVARSTAELHRQLGDEGFEIAADKGAQRTPAEGVVEALDLMRAATEPAATTRDAVAPDLTPRQLETLALVAEGLTNKEIAVWLGITPKTVMHHLTIVFQILGVRTRTEAALWATAHGIRS